MKIRDRYNQTVRRGWQVRRHQDITYRKEVLSIETGAALRLYKIVVRELLDRAVDKKKLDPGKLFRKGLEEFESALANPLFLAQHLPDAKPDDLQTFRTLLRKTWSKVGKLSRDDAAKEVGEVAMAAEVHLNLSGTVVAMEFACGACYAIDEFSVYLTPAQLRELTEALSRSETMPAVASVAAGMRSPDMLAGVPIGYIHINGFTESTTQELESALMLLSPKEPNAVAMKALILDLRANSGGVFESAIETARRFLPSGVITSMVHEDPKLNFVYHAKNPGALSVPMVVIVDGDTASAAEVLAGALKENNRAVLVGQKTFGKGCTQTVLKLPQGPRRHPDGRIESHRRSILLTQGARLLRPRRHTAHRPRRSDDAIASQHLR